MWPTEGSSAAGEVDTLFLTLVGISAVVIALVVVLLVWFSLRYRRRDPAERPAHTPAALRLEIVWIVVPLVLSLVIFAWGADLYVRNAHPPKGALEIQVVAKQWMWKLSHPGGRREINELHIPVGEPVQLVLVSEDVIHSFYVPAFRVKQDVLPGRYTRLWFKAIKTGTYHLFCAEYCGTNHSRMVGKVIVMEPARYQAWLSGSTGKPPREEGRVLFDRLGCGSCHGADAAQPGPRLVGLFGSTVRLRGGGAVRADETYLRRSIVNPLAQVVDGFDPNMPTYRDQVDEEDLFRLVAYLKSLGEGD